MESIRGELYLLEYWPALLRRRWVILLAIVGCGLVALVGAVTVKPLYRATATIQIERQSPDILTFRDLSKVDYSWAAYSEFYQTQYRLIASRPVAKLAFNDLRTVSGLESTDEAKKPGLLARVRGLLPSWGPETIVSEEDRAIEEILGALEVAPVRDSHLVEISWVAMKPERAAAVANAISDAYIRFSITSRYDATEEATEFLTEQIVDLNGQVKKLEESLQSYGQERRIVSIDDSSNITLKALKDISERKTAAETDLARKLAAYDSVRGTPIDALPEVMSSNLIARLREEYAGYEVLYSEQRKQFKDDWPGLVTLRSKLDQAKERLQLESRRIAGEVRDARKAEYEAVAQEVANLSRLQVDHEGAAQVLKKDAIEYTQKRTAIVKKRETLDALLQRKDEMDLATSLKDLKSSSVNVRIMQEARVPLFPFKPNKKARLLLGLALGLGLGVVLALFLEYVDNTITSVAELERASPLPVYAVIPRLGNSSRMRRRQPMAAAESIDLIAHRDGRAGVTEAYRELRTSLLLSSAGHPPQKIMITSAMPSEGKTATALNLATVLAQLGRRVLLIDTDLRRPRLHKAFGVENTRGVSTYLSGLADDPADPVVKTHIPNLDLLPSGPIPPNPSELLNSDTFAGMSRRLIEAGYDHLLFDSPPTLSVSDAVIIASMMEIGILVVRAGRTPRQSIRAAAEKLAQIEQIPFGLVLNDLDPDSHGATYYRQYYGRYGEPEAAQVEPDDEERVRGRGA